MQSSSKPQPVDNTCASGDCFSRFVSVLGVGEDDFFAQKIKCFVKHPLTIAARDAFQQVCGVEDDANWTARKFIEQLASLPGVTDYICVFGFNSDNYIFPDGNFADDFKFMAHI